MLCTNCASVFACLLIVFCLCAVQCPRTSDALPDPRHGWVTWRRNAHSAHPRALLLLGKRDPTAHGKNHTHTPFLCACFLPFFKAGCRVVGGIQWFLSSVLSLLKIFLSIHSALSLLSKTFSFTVKLIFLSAWRTRSFLSRIFSTLCSVSSVLLPLHQSFLISPHFFSPSRTTWPLIINWPGSVFHNSLVLWNKLRLPVWQRCRQGRVFSHTFPALLFHLCQFPLSLECDLNPTSLFQFSNTSSSTCRVGFRFRPISVGTWTYTPSLCTTSVSFTACSAKRAENGAEEFPLIL